MSLAIAVTVPEGLIVAADSRSAGGTGNAWRVATDNAEKLLPFGHYAIAAAGQAFTRGQPIIVELQKLAESPLPGTSFDDDVTEIRNRMLTSYAAHKAHLASAGFTPPKVESIFAELLVAGFDADFPRAIRLIFFEPSVNFPDGYLLIDPLQKSYGMTWIGVTDVVERIFWGYASSSVQVQPAVKALLTASKPNIVCATLKLQDALDIAVFGIEATKAVQRFCTGPRANMPSDTESVAGPIDAIKIGADKAPTWVLRKELTIRPQLVTVDLPIPSTPEPSTDTHAEQAEPSTPDAEST